MQINDTLPRCNQIKQFICCTCAYKIKQHDKPSNCSLKNPHHNAKDAAGKFASGTIPVALEWKFSMQRIKEKKRTLRLNRIKIDNLLSDLITAIVCLLALFAKHLWMNRSTVDRGRYGQTVKRFSGDNWNSFVSNHSKP